MLARSAPRNDRLLVLDARRCPRELTRENAATFPREHLRAARLSVTDLQRRGVTSDANELRALGFDSYDMVSDALLLQSAIDAFGAIPVRDAFLRSEEDAVAFAGSEAVERLCVTSNDLLAACRGTPTCAYAVLSQIEPHARFACVTVGVLAGTGLRANSLAELGYSGVRLFR